LSLYVHTNVREDALDLFGFQTSEEKELFLTVISVNGIGPRVGMGIISSIDAQGFVDAILTGDKALLTRIPGVGKKTAERMILELADPIRKKSEAGLLGARKTASAPERGRGAVAGPRTPDLREDARDALMGLGYREHEIGVLLEQIFKDSAPTRVEDVVRAALRGFGGGHPA
jgi:Holliday junction DNA helicase RuvA